MCVKERTDECHPVVLIMSVKSRIPEGWLFQKNYRNLFKHAGV